MSKRFTAEELAKLREIAEAATPGPWAVNPFRATVDEMPSMLPICGLLWPTDQRTEEQTLANATHISTFDPPTVLALLDEIERLRREREVLMEALMPASEVLADLDQSYYRVAKQDPGGYVMGSASVASLVTVIESTRKALVLLDDEKGGGGE